MTNDNNGNTSNRFHCFIPNQSKSNESRESGMGKIQIKIMRGYYFLLIIKYIIKPFLFTVNSK